MYVHTCDLPKPNIGTFYKISRVGKYRSWKKQLNNTDIWQITTMWSHKEHYGGNMTKGRPYVVRMC